MHKHEWHLEEIDAALEETDLDRLTDAELNAKLDKLQEEIERRFDDIQAALQVQDTANRIFDSRILDAGDIFAAHETASAIKFKKMAKFAEKIAALLEILLTT